MRKPGKLPWKARSASYALEYGTDTLEMHEDALGPADRVLVVDDVIATGGTARAAGELVEALGARSRRFSSSSSSPSSTAATSCPAATCGA